MRKNLNALEELAPHIVGTYLQGSYALHTTIRPRDEEEEYDVDVVLAMDTDELDDKDDLLNWLAGLVDDIALYSGKVEIRERCLRIRYESDGQRFHLDVLPAHQPEINDDPIEIPMDWIKSNPRGFVQWLNTIRNDHCARVRHIVRLLKYWRNRQFGGDSSAPKSMAFTALIATMVPKDEEYDALDDALVQTMIAIDTWLQDLSNSEEVTIPNPSLESENLARAWAWSDVEDFREVFHEATLLAKDAIACKDEAETIALWRDSKLFGDVFPKKIRGLGEKAKDVSRAMEAEALFIQSNGEVTMTKTSNTYSVKNNRGFFGEQS